MTLEDEQRLVVVQTDHDFVMPPEYRDTEGFLAELYERAGVMFTAERGALDLAEFGPQEVPEWDTRKDYRRLILERGRLMRGGDGKVYGLALGHRGYIRSVEDTRLQLQFGVSPGIPFAGATLEGLATLLSRSNIRGAGRIYQRRPLGNIEVESWADGRPFGGILIGNWFKDDLLTPRGLDEALDVIRQHTLRVF